jgi:hypothetical protein
MLGDAAVRPADDVDECLADDQDVVHGPPPPGCPLGSVGAS